MTNFIKRIESFFYRFKRSKDGRVLASNFAYLSLLQIIGYVFPLITIPYLAHVIGAKGYGSIAFAASVIIYFQTFVEWGFSYTAVRDIAKCKDDIPKVSKIFSTVLLAKVLLMIFALAFFSILIYSVPLFYTHRVILWLTFLSIPATILFPEWLFQALEEMKYITIMSFCARLIFTILIFVVITDASDYIWQPLLNAVAMLISGLWALYYARKRFGISFVCPSFREIFMRIKSSANMFISLFLPNLYTNFSVTLLGFTGGEVATGIFSAGKNFVDICDRFSMVLSRAFYPFLARRLDKHNVYVMLSGTMSLFMGLFLFAGADLLIQIFYTPEFDDATKVLRIMSVAPFFLFLMNTYGPNYLVLRGREDILRNIIFYCSIGGFILAWYAITHFTYIGVAFTMTFVWAVRGILTWWFAKKLKSKSVCL